MHKNDELARLVVDLFKKNKNEDLRKKVSQLTEGQLERLFENCSANNFSDVHDLVKAIFSCVDRDSHAKRKSLAVFALNVVKQGRISFSSVSAIISTILSELDLLPSQCLVELIYYYFEQFSTGGPCGQRWIEVLPKLFQNLLQFEEIKLKNNEVFSSQEGKGILVNQFCSQEWNPDMLVHIVTTLRELNLNQNELRNVVDKTMVVLKTIPLIDVPPVIYQILSLISLGEKSDALRKICDFFTKIDENSGLNDSAAIVKEVEGTVFLHIMFAAKQNQEVGRVLIQIFKNNPLVLLKPFNSALLLSLSEISRFKDQALDLFKATLINCLKDKERRTSSIWIRSKISDVVDGELILKRLIEDCSCGWDYVLEGLLKLGFILLETHLPKVTTFGGKILSGSNVIAHNACRWGELVVIECFKKHQNIRTTLIKQVLEAIFLQSSSALYFIEVLARFVGISPCSVLECKEKILEHFEHLPLLPHDVAIPFVKVFMPLIKLKPDLREKLIEMLKKAIFSKELEARKTAVGGFLLFLRYFQAMTAFLNSQSSQSQSFPTFSSQMLSGSCPSDRQKLHYEKLCLEVVCCLRKALSQQGDVRKMLYTGLYNAARRNRQILQPVIDLLIRQLDQYIEGDDEKLPPLLLEKCVVANKDGALLMEPLGSLIQAISSCHLLAENASDVRDSLLDENVFKNVKRTLSGIVKKLAQSELEDFSLDKSADYSHETSTGPKNALLAIELLSIYETSLEFCWKNNDFSFQWVELIGHLQECHLKLVEVLREKCVLNTNKKAAAAKVNAPGQAVNKVNTVAKKMDGSIMQLSSVVDFLTPLLCDSEREHQESLNFLRAKTEFMKWIFNLSFTKVRNCLTNPKLESSKAFENLCRFAKLMFMFYVQGDAIVDEMKRVRLNFLVETSLEIFSSIVDVVCVHYADNIESFLDFLDINNESSNDEFAEKLYKHIRIFNRILLKRLSAGNVDDEESDDKKQPKQILCLIRVIENLLKFFPHSTDQYEQLYNSFLLLCENQKVEEATVAKQLWHLFFQTQLQTELLPKKLMNISQNVYKLLGDAANDVKDIPEPDTVYNAIGVRSVNVVCQSLVNHLDILVDNNCYVITKLKQKWALSSKDDKTDEENSREKLECDCCEMFGLIIAVWQDLLKAKVSLNSSESIIRSLQKFYVALLMFIRYNSLIYQKKLGRHCSKLEKLTKKSLTHLTPSVYTFLAYVRQMEEEMSAKKKRAHNTVQAKTKIIREMKTVSALIYSIENYEKSLILLGGKCKTNFMHGAKPSTNCDFRIDLRKVRRALEANEEENVTQSTTTGNQETQKSVAAKRKSQKTTEEKPGKRRKK